MKINDASCVPGWLNVNPDGSFWFMAQNGKTMTKVTVPFEGVLHLEPGAQSRIHSIICEGGDVGVRMTPEQWHTSDYEMEGGEVEGGAP